MRLPWGLRWWELLPEAVLAAGLGFFAVTETSAATSAFGSRRALVIMGVAGAAWLATRVAVVRYARWPMIRAGVFVVAAVAVLNVVVLPSYRSKTVVETLAASPPLVTVTTVPPAPPPGVAESGAAGSAATAPPASTAPASPPAPAQPVRVRSGTFRGVNHRARGTTVIYRQPDGTLTVGLEDIDIQPGPDYDVYVVPGAEREDKSGGTRLDDLRGNKGTQYYDVPAGLDVGDGAWTVLVWCQTFGVPIATSTPV
jgi:hypothetical protein